MSVYVVLEEKGVREYLEKRQILEQYQERKERFKAGKTQQIQLKKRKQKALHILQFRITKKYRAFGYFFRQKNIYCYRNI